MKKTRKIKIINFLVLTFGIFFIFSSNVKAMYYRCVYKENGKITDEKGQYIAILNIIGEYSEDYGTNDDVLEFSLNYHNNEVSMPFYPSNYITSNKSGMKYMGYSDSKTNGLVYACPNTLTLPVLTDEGITGILHTATENGKKDGKDYAIFRIYNDKTVVYGKDYFSSDVTASPIKTISNSVSIGKFSESGCRINEDGTIDKNSSPSLVTKVMDGKIKFDYEGESKIKNTTFVLDIAATEEKTKELLSTINPNAPKGDIDYTDKYCYYKNYCGGVVAVHFTPKDPNQNIYIINKNGNKAFLNRNYFANKNITKCPTAIKVNGNQNGDIIYDAKEACNTAYDKDCYEFVDYTDNKDDSRIVNGTCGNTIELNYILLTGRDRIFIESFTGLAYLYVNNVVGKNTIQIANFYDYRDIFQSGDRRYFPSYIIKKDGKYIFSNENDGSEEVYMLTSIIPTLPSSKINLTCREIFGSSFIDFLQENVFKFIYIAIPIILIVLTTIDFSKVIFNDDKEGLKKAGTRFGKRAIAAFLIFLTPSVLILIMNIIGTDDVKKCVETISNYNKTSNSK